jgi:hypothetical protein
MTWTNPGPGALRGLLRLEGGSPGLNKRGKITRQVRVEDPLNKIRALLLICHRKLTGMPQFEMREVEHSLCEFDKYERALWGQGGRMKRRYSGAS